MSRRLTAGQTSRETALLLKYNITEEAYRVLDESQNFRCRTCGLHKTETRYGVLDVDHDHKTGQIRGLLCSACNKALGLIKENPTTLLRMIQYLKRNL